MQHLTGLDLSFIASTMGFDFSSHPSRDTLVKIESGPPAPSMLSGVRRLGALVNIPTVSFSTIEMIMCISIRVADV